MNEFANLYGKSPFTGQAVSTSEILAELRCDGYLIEMHMNYAVNDPGWVMRWRTRFVVDCGDICGRA